MKEESTNKNPFPRPLRVYKEKKNQQANMIGATQNYTHEKKINATNNNIKYKLPFRFKNLFFCFLFNSPNPRSNCQKKISHYLCIINILLLV